MFIPDHQHLIVKGFIRNPPKDETTLNRWLSSLVVKVGMVVVAGPISIYVNELGNEGITGAVILATSHSSIHVWDALETPMFQFDIYSCKSFETSLVIDHFSEFDLVSCDWLTINRNDGLVISGQGSYVSEEVI